jgi:hypothetical protein
MKKNKLTTAQKAGEMFGALVIVSIIASVHALMFDGLPAPIAATIYGFTPFVYYTIKSDQK